MPAQIMTCQHCGQSNPEDVGVCLSCGAALAAFVAPVSAFRSGTPPRFAGLWTRVAAYLLDSVIAFAILLGSAIAGGLIGVPAGSVDAFVLWGLVAGSVAVFFYNALLEAGPRQATLGKRAVGVLVTDREGHRVSFERALGRALAKGLFNYLTLCLSSLLAAVVPRKRALHDLIAGTFVVESPARQAGARRVVVAVVVCGLLVVPFVATVVAAIAIPVLLRARMAGNEARAIGSLRAINAAQHQYRQACGGYAPNLPSLASPTQFLREELTAGHVVAIDGYDVGMWRGLDAADITGTPSGCQGAVTTFIVRAAPSKPGATGTRYFMLSSTGVILSGRRRFVHPAGSGAVAVPKLSRRQRPTHKRPFP